MQTPCFIKIKVNSRFNFFFVASPFDRGLQVAEMPRIRFNPGLFQSKVSYPQACEQIWGIVFNDAYVCLIRLDSYHGTTARFLFPF